ncbi:hypothetical protein ANCDUO_00271 [Ancylostoma duodenale]|uniref:Receptor ligand binding region domain-containing protein n=1 Tax=Ancylostoma duodenale TaxID=51022 RepID=A0A0C2E1Y0_9BILA|nr:hypothetical protein ANCDUO_00271 [Ancylostoma duodenale]
MAQNYAVALANVVQHFGWGQFAYIYGGAKCSDINTDLAKVVYRMSTVFTSKTAFIPDPNPEALKLALSRTRIVARKPAVVRRALLAAFDLGMINDEFLYIIVNSQSGVSTANGTLVPMWQDVSASPDGRDADAMAAYQKTISISTLRSQDKNIANFRKKVIEKMRLPPFNCIQECANPAYQQGSQYSYQLYNIIVLYAKALNRTISEDPSQLRNGIAGAVTVNSRGQLVPTLIVSIIDSAGKPEKILTVDIDNYKANITELFTDPKVLWAHYGGRKPLAVPVCGFESMQKMVQEKKINMKWLIPFSALQEVNSKKMEASLSSLQSKQTNRTDFSLMPSISRSDKFDMYMYENDPVVAEKHTTIALIEKTRYTHLRKQWKFEAQPYNVYPGMMRERKSKMRDLSPYPEQVTPIARRRNN